MFLKYPQGVPFQMWLDSAPVNHRKGRNLLAGQVQRRVGPIVVQLSWKVSKGAQGTGQASGPVAYRERKDKEGIILCKRSDTTWELSTWILQPGCLRSKFLLCLL